MKHTQGPWKIREVSRSDGEFDIFISDEFGDADAVIAQIIGGLGRVSDDDRCYESEANAHLIASAPSLLLACESAVEWLDACGWPEGYGAPKNFIAALDVLKAAIARAEGE